LDRYKITCSFSSSGFILAARRAFLHLSYSYASPCGPALLVTQHPKGDILQPALDHLIGMGFAVWNRGSRVGMPNLAITAASA
jgi:hypothetical protein